MAITVTKVSFTGDREYGDVSQFATLVCDVAFDNAYIDPEPADLSAYFAAGAGNIKGSRQVPGGAGTGGFPYITAANPNNIVACSHDLGTPAAGGFHAVITTTGAVLGAVSAVGLSAVRMEVYGNKLLTYGAPASSANGVL